MDRDKHPKSPSHNPPNGRTCHRENTEMPPQLTFCQTRDEAQKSEQHQPQGVVKKLAVIFSQFAVNANNDAGERKRWSLPRVLVAAGILLTIVLVSPPLSESCVCTMYISHGSARLWSVRVRSSHSEHARCEAPERRVQHKR